MIDIAHITAKTLEEKVDLYYKTFKTQGKNYTKEQIKEGLEYLSYHTAQPLPKEEDPNHPILYVFRHGQTEDNAHFIFSGWREPHLTADGREQALVLAKKLENKKIDMLISSPQVRAIETMHLAINDNKDALELEIQLDERIKERNYGIYQGKSKLEVHLEDPEGLLAIRRNFKNVPEQGESIEMVCKRVAEFCDEIIPLMKEHKLNVAISCHGNSIRGFRRYFENLSDYDTAHVETMLGQDYLAYSIK